ncbi:MAG: nicotinate (nicotinamide) nucleotide adenylyltransferase [Clostridia bacterium]|nr:nicotinate (nicotinamide) nucleotide adenylyltransferase [Clostridia bacterium]
MNLGIFGGTFNPVHKGHITASLKFYDDAKLDKLLIIPDRIPPHKEGLVANSRDRLNMLCLVYNDTDITQGRNISVSETELNRSGKSYTIVTLRELKIQFPDAKLFLYVGSDMFYTLENWVEGTEILRMCTVYTAARESDEQEKMQLYADSYSKKYGTECIIADFSPIVLSSTEIRSWVSAQSKENCSDFTKNLLTDSVKSYIMENGLYLGKDITNKNELDDLCRKVREQLPELVNKERLSHILAVTETALMLADFFTSLGITVSHKKIELSALLHDVTKCMNQEELCEKYKIYLSPCDIASPATIHAITGAYYARVVYGADSEIFSAVLRHTVGGIDMTLPEKIIFLSDYCEPTRNYEECKASRLAVLEMMKTAKSISFENAQDYALITFDLIVADILGKTISHLKNTGCFVHPATISSFNDIIEKHRDNRDFANLAKKYL